jgi:DNA polymerase III gamma/tau subunit
LLLLLALSVAIAGQEQIILGSFKNASFADGELKRLQKIKQKDEVLAYLIDINSLKMSVISLDGYNVVAIFPFHDKTQLKRTFKTLELYYEDLYVLPMKDLVDNSQETEQKETQKIEKEVEKIEEAVAQETDSEEIQEVQTVQESVNEVQEAEEATNDVQEAVAEVQEAVNDVEEAVAEEAAPSAIVENKPNPTVELAKTVQKTVIKEEPKIQNIVETTVVEQNESDSNQRWLTLVVLSILFIFVAVVLFVQNRK